MSKLQGVFEVSKVVLTVVICAIVIRYFIFQPFIVEGASMEPTFYNGEYLLVEKVSYRLHDPNRGDTIVFRYPNNDTVNYIKRVIGLPGETVRIEDGNVFINDKQLNESYLSPGKKTIVSGSAETPYEISLSSTQYFVMGDNRDHSSDSREGWLVKKSDIIGHSAIVLYPRQDFHAVASPNY